MDYFFMREQITQCQQIQQRTHLFGHHQTTNSIWNACTYNKHTPVLKVCISQDTSPIMCNISQVHNRRVFKVSNGFLTYQNVFYKRTTWSPRKPANNLTRRSCWGQAVSSFNSSNTFSITRKVFFSTLLRLFRGCFKTQSGFLTFSFWFYNSLQHLQNRHFGVTILSL